MNKVHHINGSLLLGEDVTSFSEAVANVFLLDVSLVDASSRVIAKQSIQGISHMKGMKEYIRFDLNAENLDKKNDYTIRVHISLHDSDEVMVGDYISTESYSIFPAENNPAPITVTVHEVG